MSDANPFAPGQQQAPNAFLDYLSGNQSGAGQGGMQAGSTPPSGANYGPTDAGKDGISPGRSSAVSAASALGPGGFGMVAGLGNGFNAGVQSAQLGDLAGQMQGAPPATTGQQMASFAQGVVGLGMNNEAFGQNAIALGYGPDQTAAALANFAATGNMNSASQASAPTGFGFSAQGGGVTGMNSDVGVNPASEAAFGASLTGVSMGQDSSGTNMAGGTPSADFGGMASGMGTASANSNSEGSQGGSGAASDGAGGNDGGASGGGGANGGGGDNGGGWKDGGVVAPHHDFSRGSGLTHAADPEGLVEGDSGGRDDAVHVRVPIGSFVIPADVVANMGDGNTMAGGQALARAMPRMHDGVPSKGNMLARLSAGEFVVHPAHVLVIGNGNMADGIKKLKAMVEAERKK